MKEMLSYEELSLKLGFKEKNILAMYPYGSHVYGTNTQESDQDYITIFKHIREPRSLVERNSLSFVLHDLISFQRGLWGHEPFALETFFLPKENCLKQVPEIKWDFELKKNILRESFSQKASHSWVKAKKKIFVEKDYRRGKKSLFHSLRILTFGIQLAENGCITDYSAANHFWWSLYKNSSIDYDDYLKEFRPIYNSLCSKFREVCPKE